MTFTHDSIARYAKGRKITFGSKLIVLPLLGGTTNPPLIALGIELPDGSAVFIGAKELKDYKEVLEAADRAARLNVN